MSHKTSGTQSSEQLGQVGSLFESLDAVPVDVQQAAIMEMERNIQEWKQKHSVTQPECAEPPIKKNKTTVSPDENNPTPQAPPTMALPTEEQHTQPIKRGRGRPRKVKAEEQGSAGSAKPESAKKPSMKKVCKKDSFETESPSSYSRRASRAPPQRFLDFQVDFSKSPKSTLSDKSDAKTAAPITSPRTQKSSKTKPAISPKKSCPGRKKIKEVIVVKKELETDLESADTGPTSELETPRNSEVDIAMNDVASMESQTTTKQQESEGVKQEPTAQKQPPQKLDTPNKTPGPQKKKDSRKEKCKTTVKKEPDSSISEGESQKDQFIVEIQNQNEKVKKSEDTRGADVIGNDSVEGLQTELIPEAHTSVEPSEPTTELNTSCIPESTVETELSRVSATQDPDCQEASPQEVAESVSQRSALSDALSGEPYALLTDVTCNSDSGNVKQEAGDQNAAQDDFSEPIKKIKKKYFRKAKQCDICGKTVKDLTKHKLYHDGGPKTRLPCPYCSYTTVYKENLFRHKQVKHSTHKPHLCPSCDMAFVNKLKLRTHIRMEHGDGRIKSHGCPECPFITNNVYALRRHISNIHEVRDKFECPFCKLKLRYKDTYNVHLRRHTGEKPYHCRICSSSFNSSSCLNQHMKTHKEKQHMCLVCHKRFTTRHHMERHCLSVHQLDKPFQCPFCRYSCNNRYNLRKHCKTQHHQIYPPMSDTQWRNKLAQARDGSIVGGVEVRMMEEGVQMVVQLDQEGEGYTLVDESVARVTEPQDDNGELARADNQEVDGLDLAGAQVIKQEAFNVPDTVWEHLQAAVASGGEVPSQLEQLLRDSNVYIQVEGQEDEVPKEEVGEVTYLVIEPEAGQSTVNTTD